MRAALCGSLRKNGKLMDSVFLFVVGALVLCGGVMLFVRSLKNLRRVKESAHWPCFMATITHAEVEKRRGVDLMLYVPCIRFSYEVDGRGYSGSHIGFGFGGIGAERSAGSLVRKYPVSRRLYVAVDPDDHKVAVLEPNKRALAYLFVLSSVLVQAMGLYMIYIPSAFWLTLK
jgi:hypothetical protein